MRFRELVANHDGRLTRADREVLDVLLSHPTEAAFLSADEVTARAGVHVAGATRLAQKLGFSGYPQLRERLRTDLLADVGPADRVRRRLEASIDGHVVEDLASAESAALEDLPRSVAQAQLDEVAALVLGADRVLVYARGNADVLARLLVRRLRRFGLRVMTLPGDPRDLAEELVGLQEDDVVLALAFRRASRTLDALLETSAEVGATSVFLTDTLASQVHPDPSVVLAAPRGSGRDFQSLTVPMAVANALVLTIARLGAERTMPALERLQLLLDRFDS